MRWAPPTGLQVGDRLDVGVDFSKASRTILLVFKSDCRFCSESMPFYRDVAQRLREQTNSRVQFVGLSVERTDLAAAYLKDHRLDLAEIRTVDPAKLRVRGTPTLLLADNKGAVLRVWRGLLPGPLQPQILSALLGSATGAGGL